MSDSFVTRNPIHNCTADMLREEIARQNAHIRHHRKLRRNAQVALYALEVEARPKPTDPREDAHGETEEATAG